MKTWRRPLQLVTGIVAFSAIGGVWFFHTALAATGSIYITPASNSVQNGSTVTVSLRINPGTTVDSVQGSVTFDTSKLQYVSVNTAGTAFSTEITNSQSGGSVAFARGDFGAGVSSDALIETLTFKALVGSGSSTIGLSGANADAAGTFTNPSTIGASVNFTTPVVAPPTCPTGTTGTYPNCVTPPATTPITPPKTGGGSTGTGGGTSSGGSTSTGTTTTPPSTAPAAVTIASQTVQYTQVIFNLTSPQPTQVYLKYGINGQLSTNTPVSGFATSHQITLDPTLLVPGETYSYAIVSISQQGVTTQGATQSFMTKGLTVSVGVFDKNRQPIKNKTVVLHSTAYTVKTDSKGIATFQNVTPGLHHLTYTAGKKSYGQALTVTNNVQTAGATQTAATQHMSVVYAFAQQGSVFTSRWFMGSLVVLVAAAATACVLRRNIRFAGFGGGSPVIADAVVVGGATPAMLAAEQPSSDMIVPTPPKAISSVPVVTPASSRAPLNAIPTPVTPAPGHLITPIVPSTPHDPTEKVG